MFQRYFNPKYKNTCRIRIPIVMVVIAAATPSLNNASSITSSFIS